MATWLDVHDYLRSNYRIEEGEGIVYIKFQVGGGRSQEVSISQREVSAQVADSQVVHRESWIIIQSPFARIEQINLERILQETLLLVWGIATTGTHLVLRHSLPIQNLDLNELETPLHLLTIDADALEQKWMEQDRY